MTPQVQSVSLPPPISKDVLDSNNNDVLPMGSFHITERDFLVVSITVNACLFLQGPVGRKLGCLFTRYGGRQFKSLTSLIYLHPYHFGQLLMEVGVLLVIVLLTINETFHSRVHPFSQDSSTSSYQQFRFIFCISIGRFLVIAGNLAFSHHRHYHHPSNSSSNSNYSYQHRRDLRSFTGHSGKLTLDFIYYVINIISFVISLGFRENHLLVLTSSFMELNVIQIAVKRVHYLHHNRQTVTNSNAPSNRIIVDSLPWKRVLLCFFVFSLTRILLPMTFLGLAVYKESPLQMSTVPFVWFAFCSIFYGVFHIFLLSQVLQDINRVLISSSSYRPSCVPFNRHWSTVGGVHHSSDVVAGLPFLNHPNSSDFLSNDLHSNILHSSSKEDRSLTLPHDWRNSSETKTISNVNYSVLHCYDNRNLYYSNHNNSSQSGMEETKMNFEQKIMSSKDELFYIPTSFIASKLKPVERLAESDGSGSYTSDSDNGSFKDSDASGIVRWCSDDVISGVQCCRTEDDAQLDTCNMKRNQTVEAIENEESEMDFTDGNSCCNYSSVNASRNRRDVDVLAIRDDDTE